ncbi:MAG: PfkB family carbohydrate kinase [Propionibacteriaceae bacterium]|nr:PfkB family carbohydrate kinase [Propionibacteriaceae bacterium]
MKFRTDAQWSVIVPTSMGVRITPEAGQTVHTSDRFVMHATSAESNVASVAAALGLPAKVLTAFVSGSPISALIKRDLRARGLAYEGPEVAQGGAWGYRHQFNIADSGYGLRGPRVWNDRAGEVGTTLSIDDFDVERIFGAEGVGILHLSGLIAALSPQTSKFCVDLARAAAAHGTVISFDLNHRASFWRGREEELRAAFHEIAGLAQILIGNEEDFQLALGVQGPESGGKGLAAQLDGFTSMIGRIQSAYPGAGVLATTLREVRSANSHLWGAITRSASETCVVEPREIGVLDRIGGGDGFVGGLLYGLLRGWSLTEATHFAWASGAYAATCLTDYGLPADEAAVWSIWEGNARVQR